MNTNNKQKNTHTVLTFFSALLCVFSFTTSAYAANISVVFEQTPLFSEGDVKPGDSISRTVTVTNTSGAPQNVYVKAENGFSTGSLADTLFLTVVNGSTFISDLPVSSFIDGAERALTQNLANGASVAYTFTVDFPSSAGNEYQLGTAGFDFCIGFSAGQNGCISDGNGGGEGGGGGGSGGGGGGSTPTGGGGGGGGNGPVSGTIPLDTFNEDAQNITLAGDATIVWDTNLPATSKVVFGLQSGGSYSLNLFDSNFGYPLGTSEEVALGLNHSIPLGGLIPGETYVYRVASRQNPTDVFTVSPEFIFTVPLTGPSFFSTDPFGGEGGGGSLQGGGSPGGGTGGGAQGGVVESENGGGETQGGAPEENYGQAAAAFFGIPDFLNNLFDFGECECAWVTSLIALLGYLFAVWFGKEFIHAITPIETTFRRHTGIALIGAAGALVAWFVNIPCAMLSLLVMAVLVAFSAVLDFFTAASVLPYTRLMRILTIFVIGMGGATLYAFVGDAWCYLWPFAISLVVLIARMIYVFVVHGSR